MTPAERTAARIADILRTLTQDILTEAKALEDELANVPPAAELAATDREICAEIAHLEARLARVRDAQAHRAELEAALTKTRRTVQQALDLADSHQRDMAPPPAAETVNALGLPPVDDLLAPGVVDARRSPYGSFEGPTVPRLPNGRIVPPPGPIEAAPLAEVLETGSPLTTVTDVSPPDGEGPRHAAPKHDPKDESPSTISQRFKAITGRLRSDDDQDGASSDG